MVYEGTRCKHSGHLEGTGRLFYAPGKPCYVGQWKRGQQHGTGDQYTVDGALLYRGGWKHGLRHGQGCLFYQAETEEGKQEAGLSTEGTTLYSGGWAAGKFHGHGVLYHRDGTVLLSGRFRDGELMKTA